MIDHVVSKHHAKKKKNLISKQAKAYKFQNPSLPNMQALILILNQTMLPLIRKSKEEVYKDLLVIGKSYDS